MVVSMEKIPNYFPYGIIPFVGADLLVIALLLLRILNIFSLDLSGNLAFIIAATVAVLFVLSPAVLFASLIVWKHENSHKHSYNEQGVYRDGQLIVSWPEVESVLFRQKSDSYFKLGPGVWAKPAYNSDGTPRGKIKQRMNGSITFYPRRGFGINQVEVTIPITKKTASMNRLYEKMKKFAASAGLDSIFEIRLNLP